MHHSSLFSGASRALVVVVLAALFPYIVSAQQLRIIDQATTEIDPTAYRAYYGKLTGEPHLFTFTTSEETPLMFVLAVPDVPDATTDISATLIDVKNPDGLFETADGGMVEWQRFFDTAGRDSYLAGPTVVTTVPPGEYRLQVSSAADDASYVLIVSGEDSFSFLETLRRYGTVPTIKSHFFGKSAAEAYLTPLLLWPIFAVLILAALIVFILIIVRRRRAQNLAE
jgi:hypothetical protein